MTKKETPAAAAKAASASGAGAQGVQTKTSTDSSAQPAGASTAGQEAVLKDGTTDLTGMTSSETNVATPAGALGTDSITSASAGADVHPGGQVMSALNIDQGGEDDQGEPGVMVVARYEGFRRAGRTWSMQPTVVPLSELTHEQLRMLDNDPNLRMRAVDITPDMDGDDK